MPVARPVPGPPGLHLHRVAAGDWASHRDLRLQMLREAPDAFWTTYEEVADRTEQDWRASVTGAACVLQARSADDTPLGTLGILPEGYADDVPFAQGSVNLIAMYVVPAARGSGVGDLLMAGARELTLELGRRRILLEVTSSNAAAIRLYERTGFRFTGATTPHPRRADLVEREMAWELTAAGGAG
ncbi:GNAT family N-acetyltransferase [Ornithinicoccus hortensis]|uniref:Acetyltransferase (GNAT) family protein n=1 Tax=Ornithinicoccus hortensis TaxID=82346 RepID=A0A542YR07_9MICO|nr:GNAT family N-acetyltransferase [Ornithinicoccus hortensis]TQL50526.1 acetyltransferase (GNAT) family protein [Ornithinicoccus hortensis]